MTKMKKFAALSLAGIMALSMCACGKSDNKKENDTTKAEQTEANKTEADKTEADSTTEGNTEGKTYTIGICQLVEHPALDAATEGFKTALTEKLGASVVFDEKNAQNDTETCSTIVNGFTSANVDLIMANATPALQAAVAATDSIPILATSITEYGVALGIDNFDGKTGMNVSGTSDLAPLAEQAAMVKELFPDAEKVALIYCSQEANSAYQVKVVGEELEKLGYETKEFTFADSNDINSVCATVADYADVVYVPTDNTAAENTSALYNVFGPAKIPVIAGEEGICKGCGVATLSISYSDIGYQTGVMAYEILVEGKDISEMEIAYAPKFTKKYNKTICDELGIEIPEGYEVIEE